jgi:hypothetical protein
MTAKRPAKFYNASKFVPVFAIAQGNSRCSSFLMVRIAALLRFHKFRRH